MLQGKTIVLCADYRQQDLVVIDGHNRKNLCEKHNIPYKLAVFAFDDLLEAKCWAVENQKGRRNLDKWELGKIALKLKPDIEARAKKYVAWWASVPSQ